jgi:hypothetical protein
MPTYVSHALFILWQEKFFQFVFQTLDEQRCSILRMFSSHNNQRARIFKLVWSPVIDSEESNPPGWESLPGSLKG